MRSNSYSTYNFNIPFLVIDNIKNQNFELCANLVNESHFTQIHWGLHGITYENWKKLNGHQEFIAGWGAEDCDFRLRAIMMGLKPVYLDRKYVYQIPQGHVEKATNRKIKDISESSLINQTRFLHYRESQGYVGNYSKDIGSEYPIEFVSLNEDNSPPQRMWCFRSNSIDKYNPPDELIYSKEFDMFYIISQELIDCKKYVDGPFWHFYISGTSDIDKYLFQIM